MGGEEWEPLTVEEAARLLEGAPFRWFVCGGHALELHTGDRWRSHQDLDIGISRYQAPAALRWFDGFDVYIAASGELRPWAGVALDPSRHENNVWIRRSSEDPWIIDLTVGEGSDSQWIYRRAPEVRRSWEAAALFTETGIPYLAPDLQMLSKSKQPRAKDHADAERVIPDLSLEQQAFLDLHLPPGHPWRSLLRGESK